MDYTFHSTSPSRIMVVKVLMYFGRSHHDTRYVRVIDVFLSCVLVLNIVTLWSL